MKELWNMTKEELIAKCRRLQLENENLQDELDRLSDAYSDLENDFAEIANAFDSLSGVGDINWFIHRLELDGLMTPELYDFIENYLKFYIEKG